MTLIKAMYDENFKTGRSTGTVAFLYVKFDLLCSIRLLFFIVSRIQTAMADIILTLTLT